jgi:hypothetical protein
VLLADSGYVGMDSYHANTRLPHKNTKKHKLTKEQKQENRQLSSERIGVEHVFSFIKRFKIFSTPYRNRRKRFGLRFNLFAAIANLENAH